MEDFKIKNVLRKKGFVRVVFKSESEEIKADFADKLGQYRKFCQSKKSGECFSREYIKLYNKEIV